ncbi:MAG: hypothetical protein QY325_07320 [Flavobacteriales bacterium]|jgi:hypothetical protein|nr:MAG: hypothetical protein QY325_07320 [Flavobacteriales bacterium]
MSFTVKIEPPVVGKSIKVQGTCQGNYRFLRADTDTIDSSFLLVHFTCLSGAGISTRTIDTGIVHQGGGSLRKFNALVIADNMIKARDRKTIRDGRSITG